jgi:hypothetical protein
MVIIINNHNSNGIIRIEIDQIQVEVIHNNNNNNNSILIDTITIIISNFSAIDIFFNLLLSVLPVYCFSFSFLLINKVTDGLSYKHSK